MKLRSRNKVDATFNMASMTDIVFLLLIFFIVLSTFVTVNGLDIDLPKVSANKNPINSEIQVEISKDYTYAINGQVTSYDGVIGTLKDKAVGKEFPALILFADGAISWEKGLEVIAAAKIIGYTKIVVRTEAKQ